jgi:microcystin degradation protein MlrC
MNLVQRALTWEAREPGLFVNFFFGFPWSDVPDVGMTFQALTNNNPNLARAAADDMATITWRQREALLNAAKIFAIDAGEAAAKLAVANGAGPVVLADHSDRSRYATWLLRAVIEQGLSRALIGTVADTNVVAGLMAKGAKVGEAVDLEIGGLVDQSAGLPVRARLRAAPPSVSVAPSPSHRRDRARPRARAARRNVESPPHRATGRSAACDSRRARQIRHSGHGRRRPAHPPR